MTKAPAEFQFRVVVGKGKRRGQLIIDVTPEGLDQESCTNCGEVLINKEIAETLDLMNAYTKAKWGEELLRIIEEVRKETKIK